MSLKECPSCTVETNDQNNVCHICGYEFPQRKKSATWVTWLMILLFAGPLLYMLISYF